MTQYELVLADELGAHLRVRPETIRAWVRTGKIPRSTYLKVGTTYRFDVEAVVAALRAGDTPTVSGSETKVEAVGGSSLVGDTSVEIASPHDYLDLVNVDEDL